MKRVTGIGGIFFKSKNPTKIKDWYQKHLGIETDAYGSTFEWRSADEVSKKGFTQWSPMKDTTDYLNPSTKDFMINYRVENIEKLVPILEKEGVRILDKIASYEYGKFVHIIDVEGNKIELWEPIDDEYDKIVGARTK